MKKVLEQIRDKGGQATFLLPSLPTALNGKITGLTATRVRIEGTLKNKRVNFITHPNNVVVVTPHTT